MNLLRLALTSAFLVGSSVIAPMQPARTVADLTVPANQLPSGCSLSLSPAVQVAAGGRAVVFPGDPQAMPTNPWAGSDRKTVAAIHKRIDGEPQVPDAMPLDRRAAAAYEMKWADDVAEAYRATYRLADDSIVDVLAVRFNDPALAKPIPPPGVKNPPRGLRLVIGPMVVFLSGKDGACFQAVSKHLQSLR